MNPLLRSIRTAAAIGFLLVGLSDAATLAEQLLQGYEKVQTVTCEIRREVTSDRLRPMRMLSRVYFQRPDRLHVENTSPVPRRIVADGVTFYSYAEGDPKGFSRPIAELDEEMLIGLRKVPGTAMEHLLRLRGVAETNLPGTDDFPVRRGYSAEKVFVVLSLDKEGRLARVEFFSGPDLKTQTARYDYSAFQEPIPGVWFPCLHQAVASLEGVESRETTRVNNLSVNTPIAPSLFVAAPFFKKVRFASSFEDIYKP